MRLQDCLEALTATERAALRTRRGIVLDPNKRIDEVEQTLALSILAVGCLQGEAAVRLDAGYGGVSIRDRTDQGDCLE